MGTRRVRVGCEFVYKAEVDTAAVFHVRPASAAQITVEDQRWRSEPPIAVRDCADLYGNHAVRAVLPAGQSSFGYQGVATVPDVAEDADAGACAGTSPTWPSRSAGP
jgi:hypothetical protein